MCGRHPACHGGWGRDSCRGDIRQVSLVVLVTDVVRFVAGAFAFAAVAVEARAARVRVGFPGMVAGAVGHVCVRYFAVLVTQHDQSATAFDFRVDSTLLVEQPEILGESMLFVVREGLGRAERDALNSRTVLSEAPPGGRTSR